MCIDFYQIRTFSEIQEFHNIMPISNIPSVIIHGILSNEKANDIKHTSIASPEVQKNRKKKLPNGLTIHQHANLFFHARNPMMYKRKDENICVLRVSKTVCELENVYFIDRNATCNDAKCGDLSKIHNLDFERIFSEFWTDKNEDLQKEKSHKKGAELLIPNTVDFSYVIGAYVKNERDKKRLIDLGFDKEILINEEMFFLHKESSIDALLKML